MTVEPPDAPRVRLPSGETFSRRAIDLRETGTTVSAAAVRRAVRFGRPVPPDAPEVVCPSPGPVHEYVAHLEPEMAFDRRGALSTLARSRGHATPADAELAAVREELVSLRPPPPADVASARRRAAEAGAETERLRERVATLRGRLSAHRERDGESDAVAEVEATLSETMTRLSEAATDRIAARQRLEHLESEAREARDERERRLELEDEAGNLERAVRRSLADRVYDEFASAVAALPDAFDAAAGDEPGEYGGPPAAAALAVTRLADVRAPVVVSPRVVAAFDGPDRASDFLRAPVVVR